MSSHAQWREFEIGVEGERQGKPHVDGQRGRPRARLSSAVVLEQAGARDLAELSVGERQQQFCGGHQEGEHGALRREERVDEVNGGRGEEGEDERWDPDFPVTSAFKGKEIIPGLLLDTSVTTGKLAPTHRMSAYIDVAHKIMNTPRSNMLFH